MEDPRSSEIFTSVIHSPLPPTPVSSAPNSNQNTYKASYNSNYNSSSYSQNSARNSASSISPTPKSPRIISAQEYNTSSSARNWNVSKPSSPNIQNEPIYSPVIKKETVSENVFSFNNFNNTLRTSFKLKKSVRSEQNIFSNGSHHHQYNNKPNLSTDNLLERNVTHEVNQENIRTTNSNPNILSDARLSLSNNVRSFQKSSSIYSSIRKVKIPKLPFRSNSVSGSQLPGYKPAVPSKSSKVLAAEKSLRSSSISTSSVSPRNSTTSTFKSEGNTPLRNSKFTPETDPSINYSITSRALKSNASLRTGSPSVHPPAKESNPACQGAFSPDYDNTKCSSPTEFSSRNCNNNVKLNYELTKTCNNNVECLSNQCIEKNNQCIEKKNHLLRSVSSCTGQNNNNCYDTLGTPGARSSFDVISEERLAL